MLLSQLSLSHQLSRNEGVLGKKLLLSINRADLCVPKPFQQKLFEILCATVAWGPNKKKHALILYRP